MKINVLTLINSRIDGVQSPPMVLDPIAAPSGTATHGRGSEEFDFKRVSPRAITHAEAFSMR